MNTGARPQTTQGWAVARKVLRATAWLLAGVVLGLIFLAYRQPGLLIDLVNLRYCG